MEYKTKSSTENYTIEQKSVLDTLSALCPQYINMLLKHFLFTAGEEYAAVKCDFYTLHSQVQPIVLIFESYLKMLVHHLKIGLKSSGRNAVIYLKSFFYTVHLDLQIISCGAGCLCSPSPHGEMLKNIAKNKQTV